MSKITREKIINQAVKNLREFGYPHCNTENIFTDDIYKAFFKSMLNENFGIGHDKLIKSIINEL